MPHLRALQVSICGSHNPTHNCWATASMIAGTGTYLVSGHGCMRDSASFLIAAWPTPLSCSRSTVACCMRSPSGTRPARTGEADDARRPMGAAGRNAMAALLCIAAGAGAGRGSTDQVGNGVSDRARWRAGERTAQRAARGKQQAVGAAPGTAGATHTHLPTSTRKTFFIIAPLARDSSSACLDVASTSLPSHVTQ